jgi:orotidine 5'-phosphate decarboxylase subfamily 1
LVKIGSQLFTAEGPNAVKRIAKLVEGIFLDLKFCDIPNTVSGAVKSAAALPGVRMMTLHATGGLPMLQAARAALKGIKRPPMLLAVTVLTSLDAAELERIGLRGPFSERVAALAEMAHAAEMDGIVAPATELQSLRSSAARNFKIIVPGIRPASLECGGPQRGFRLHSTGTRRRFATHSDAQHEVGSSTEAESARGISAGSEVVAAGFTSPIAERRLDDQAQIATPANAIRWGADYLVVGRPITAAPDPVAAFDAIAREIESASS